MIGNDASIIDVLTVGCSRKSRCCVSVAGVAVVTESAAVSLQQAGCELIATAACAQHGFIAHDPRASIAGSTPVIIRMAMAANVRITIANLCTTFAIPN